MNIAILGLGYVGCVTAACLAREGHHVIGVDVNAAKVSAVRQGKSPIVEPNLTDLLAQGVEQGRIEATQDMACAVANAELLVVCVGTPSRPNGDLDLTYVERVCASIGQELRHKESYTTVVVRSTILPGSALERLIPVLEVESGKEAGVDFGFCVNPEFLREGSAIADFDNPPYTVIGEFDAQSGEAIAELYHSIDAPIYRVPLGTAEMVKYASNAFHALKVVFANEIGNLCKAHGVDSHRVMEIFVEDTKLNVSHRYLKPGFAFGGSCLGKDLRALHYSARQRDLQLPVLEAVLPSNQLQIEKVLHLLLAGGQRTIAFVGLSFKANTDDLRESPAVELAERLLGKGFNLKIYDREVSFRHIFGSNRSYIEQTIPHIESLLCHSLEDTLDGAEIVVVTKPPSAEESETLARLLRPHHCLVDLVRVNGSVLHNFTGAYHGICW